MKWNPLEVLFKWLVALIFLPPLVCAVLQIVVAYLTQLLPILVVIAVAAGLAAGVGAAAGNGRRSAPRRIGSNGPPRRVLPNHEQR